MRELLFSPPEDTHDLAEQIVRLFLHGVMATDSQPVNRE
jgi:hypothetical protein